MAASTSRKPKMASARLLSTGIAAIGTLRVAAEVLLRAPLSAEVTVTELSSDPEPLMTTITETAQEAFLASVPPERLTDPLPAVAVITPPHDPTRPLGVATVIPKGRVSVKVMLVSGVAFGLATAKLRVAGSPGG